MMHSVLNIRYSSFRMVMHGPKFVTNLRSTAGVSALVSPVDVTITDRLDVALCCSSRLMNSIDTSRPRVNVAHMGVPWGLNLMQNIFRMVVLMTSVVIFRAMISDMPSRG